MSRQPAKKKAVNTKVEPAATTPVDPDFKIIHTAKCQTISKKSTLTYNFSRDNNDNIHIRINNNSGGGFFSGEWVLLDDITKLISGATDITSQSLSELFVGKSVNTHSFLAAVLLQEGVLSPLTGKQFHYVFSGTEKLMESLDK